MAAWTMVFAFSKSENKTSPGKMETRSRGVEGRVRRGAFRMGSGAINRNKELRLVKGQVFHCGPEVVEELSRRQLGTGGNGAEGADLEVGYFKGRNVNNGVDKVPMSFLEQVFTRDLLCVRPVLNIQTL